TLKLDLPDSIWHWPWYALLLFTVQSTTVVKILFTNQCQKGSDKLEICIFEDCLCRTPADKR
ncbi:unnamed protein product, partial [Musa acuminata var. zebrina]